MIRTDVITPLSLQVLSRARFTVPRAAVHTRKGGGVANTEGEMGLTKGQSKIQQGQTTSPALADTQVRESAEGLSEKETSKLDCTG